MPVNEILSRERPALPAEAYAKHDRLSDSPFSTGSQVSSRISMHRPPALLALASNGVIGTALGFWAMTVLNRRVPATTASLGVLATPVMKMGLSAIVLAEGLDPLLAVSALIIPFWVALGAKEGR